MRLLRWLLVAAFVAIQPPGVTVAGWLPLKGTSVGNNTALDGSVQGTSTGSGTTCTATITTTQTNDLVLTYVTANSLSDISAGATFSGGGLTWTSDASVSTAGVTQVDTLGYAVAASTLSAQTITATLPATVSFCILIVTAVSGANTGSPFDGSVLTCNSASSPCPAFLTTTNANDFIFAGFGANVASPTAGACCTLLIGANFQGAQYNKVTTVQSGLSMDATPTGPRAMIIRAIKSN